MPAPITTTLLAASIGAAILGLVTVFAVLAALGVAWEIALFFQAGSGGLGT